VRPSRLVLENFGPYRGRAEVDFSRLDRLFLVCGKTGSGKTSLFDAMTYALYGEAPGARLGLERQLWSHYARPGEAPLVEFEFLLGGAEYRAVRSPPYRRLRLRGKKELIEVDASAAFYRRGAGGWELLADKKGEVDDWIRRLVGLTADEFSKIILLPQGEFQRFLDMKSSDRVEVLEKLFPVAMHEAVSALAKEKSKEALTAVRMVDSDLARLGGVAEAAAAAKRLLELEAEAARLAADRDLAVGRLQAAELALSRSREAAERAERARVARERLAALEAGLPEAQGREGRIAAARASAGTLPAISAREAAEADLGSLADALRTQRSRLAELASRSSEIAGHRAEALRLAEVAAAADRELGELGTAQAAWDEARNFRGDLEAARLRSAELAARLEAALRAEELSRASRDEAAVGVEEEARVRGAFEADRAAQQEAAAAADEAAAAASLAEKAGRLAAAAVAARDKAAAASRRRASSELALAALEAADRACSAAALASGLKPGDPCPVCGSREHPAPALASSGSPDDQTLGAARSECERGRLEESEAAAAARSASDRASDAEQELRQRIGEAPEIPGDPQPGELFAATPEVLCPAGILGRRDFASLLDEAREKARESSAKLSASAAALRAMEDRRRAAAKLEADLEEARALRSRVESEAQAAAVGAARLEERLASAASRAGSSDPRPLIEAASAKRDRAKAERERLERIAAEWEADRQKAEVIVSELSAREVSIVARLEAARETEAAALAEAGFDSPASVRSAALDPAALSALEVEAQGYRNELKAAQAKAETLEAEIAASQTGPSSGAETDPGALAAAVEEARDRRDELQSALDATAVSIAELGRERDERARLVEERARLDAEWRGLNGLSALLCGELPARKLPFKNYVLGSYFRVVAERASARLSRMSDGRYSLAADEGEGRGYLGLELLVRDSHTGQSRPAGTLSGGERFMAALSLAFGLADTIRERSGGTSLDAIFIDEGFGSLDDEALDRAVAVLDEAGGARTVGIVSHVAELRARIPSRIEVSKGRSGSSLRIIS